MDHQGQQLPLAHVAGHMVRFRKQVPFQGRHCESQGGDKRGVVSQVKDALALAQSLRLDERSDVT